MYKGIWSKQAQQQKGKMTTGLQTLGWCGLRKLKHPQYAV